MKYKVALVSIDCNQELATQVLHSVMRENGYECNSFYLKSRTRTVDEMGKIDDRDIKSFLDLMKNLNPDLIGFSVRSPVFRSAKGLVDAILNLIPGVKLIWGGDHPSLFPEECIKFLDFVCIGEGEEALLELVERLSNGQSADKIKNIWSNNNRVISKNGPRAAIQNLDTLPMPVINDEKQFYISEGKIQNTYCLPEWITMTARGCPFKCWFCSNEIINETFERKTLRRRTVKHVIEELKLVKSKIKNIQTISFNDDIFTINKKWIEEFTPLYKKHIGIPFVAQVHPVFVKKDVMLLLKDAGIISVMMGIQSASERIRNEVFFRKTTDEQIIKAATILKELNVSYLRYDVLHNNPYETRQDKHDSVNLLLKIPRPYGLIIYSLLWYPKTKLTEKALKEGVINEEHIEGNCDRTQIYHRGNEIFHSQEDIYFANLYYLSATNYFPKIFVRFFVNYQFFENHPTYIDFVIFLVKLNKSFFFGLNGVIKILQGKGTKENILGGFEMLRRYITPKKYDY